MDAFGDPVDCPEMDGPEMDASEMDAFFNDAFFNDGELDPLDQIDFAEVDAFFNNGELDPSDQIDRESLQEVVVAEDPPQVVVVAEDLPQEVVVAAEDPPQEVVVAAEDPPQEEVEPPQEEVEPPQEEVEPPQEEVEPAQEEEEPPHEEEEPPHEEEEPPHEEEEPHEEDPHEEDLPWFQALMAERDTVQGDDQGDDHEPAANISAMQTQSESVPFKIKVVIPTRQTKKRSRTFFVEPNENVSLVKKLLVSKKAKVPESYWLSTNGVLLNENRSFQDQGIRGLGGVPKLEVLDIGSNFL